MDSIAVNETDVKRPAPLGAAFLAYEGQILGLDAYEHPAVPLPQTCEEAVNMWMVKP